MEIQKKKIINDTNLAVIYFMSFGFAVIHCHLALRAVIIDHLLRVIRWSLIV
jgi:hypothetical protein